MTISIVLRLVQPAPPDGGLAGEVQIVSTGEVHRVRNADELIASLREAVAAGPTLARP